MPRRLVPTSLRTCWAVAAIIASAVPGVALSIPPGDPIVTLRDEAATPENRAAAAAAALADPGRHGPQIVELLKPRPVLADGIDAVNDDQAALLRAIADSAFAPGMLDGPLGELATAPTIATPRRLLAVAALGSVKTRNSAAALVRIASEPDDAGLANAACRALVRLSGRADLGFDHRRWREWFAGLEFASEQEWLRQIAQGQAAQADALARERGQISARLVEGLRRRFQQAESAEERSRQIGEMLADPLADVRRLGLQLSLQELANARIPDASVGRATLTLLSDPAPEIRRLAAEILGVLGTADMAAAMHEALVFESDPIVASLLLRTAARWPSPRVTQTTLRWLEAGEGVRRPALNAAAALFEAGLLNDSTDRARLLRALRSTPRTELPAPGLGLLFTLGDQTERESVVALLFSADPAVRQRAADALSRDPAGLDALLTASQDDSSMFNMAAQAVLRYRPTPQGFIAVARLPAPSPEERIRQLMLIAERLSPGELLAAARSTPDLEFRERLLSRLTGEPRRSFMLPPIGSDGSSSRPELIAGLLLLAQTRIELDRPDAALKAIEALEPAHRSVQREVLDAHRTIALLLLGRVSDAARMDGPPEAWVEGLERSLDESHARAVIEEIERRWPVSSTPPSPMPQPLADRFAAAKAGVGAFVGPTSDVPRP